MNSVKIGLLLFKILVTVSLLWLIFRKFNISSFSIQITRINFFFSAAALMAMFAQLILTGLRWYFVEKMLGNGINANLSIRLILIGQFFNQVLPSSVGGDVVRALILSRENLSLKTALSSVVCDRIVALIVLTFITFCTLPILLYSVNFEILGIKSVTFLFFIFVLGGLIILLLFSNKLTANLNKYQLGRPVASIVSDTRYVIFSSRVSLWIVGLSILVQLLLILCIFFLAISLGLSLNMTHCLMLPLIMLLSSIPISFAGWGLRETFMIVGLGLVGISAGDALSISVGFGFTQMLIGLPGFVITAYMIYKYNLTKILKK